MDAAGSIALALFLTIFGVIFFWYIWVKLFEWELAVWYRSNVSRRKEHEIEAMSVDLEMGGGDGGGGSRAASKAASKHGSKKSGGGSSKHGSKAASKNSGSKGGGGSRHDSRSGSKA